MHILIVEDEAPAAKRLAKMVKEQLPETDFLTTTDSVESTVRHLSASAPPDLIFLDIQLADGLSFDIFSQVEVQTPVIFTTAYDQYTLRAFKLNSLDYLLKPIAPEELTRALSKYRRFFGRRVRHDPRLLQQIAEVMNRPAYKERFLVKAGQQITYLKVEEVRYFYSEDGLVFAQAGHNKRHAIDYTLDQLADNLDPNRFFRLNRKVIAHLDAIDKISPYFNSRLILELRPPANFEVVVSRDRATDFKNWLDR